VCADRAGKRPGERGSVLLLMPAAVLVLMVLAALAVDAAVVFLAQRELVDATAAAANDAAVAGLDEAAFYDGGRLVINPARAQEVAATAFALREVGWLAVEGPVVAVETVAGEPVRVRVSAEGRVDLVFARALPGAPGTRTVHATSVATAARAGGAQTSSAAP
jgi:Flp pilus assembly protein TadG